MHWSMRDLYHSKWDGVLLGAKSNSLETQSAYQSLSLIDILLSIKHESEELAIIVGKCLQIRLLSAPAAARPPHAVRPSVS